MQKVIKKIKKGKFKKIKKIKKEADINKNFIKLELIRFVASFKLK